MFVCVFACEISDCKKLGHGNCHKSHGKVMEKSWKFVGKNVYEP